METEMQHVLTKSSSSSSNSSTELLTESDHRYTSLKDILIIQQTPPPFVYLSGGSSYYCHGSVVLLDGNEFGSTISIRNHLVKHAASAYLQSTAILANRNQNCLTRLWRQLQQVISLRGGRPLERWVRVMARSVDHVIACLVRHFRKVYAWLRGGLPSYVGLF